MRVTTLSSAYLIFLMFVFGLMYQTGEPSNLGLMNAVNVLLALALVQGFVIVLLVVKIFEKEVLIRD